MARSQFSSPADAQSRYRTLDGFLKGTHTSKAKLARELGVSPSLVSSWVRGRTEPDLAMCIRLVERCKIPMASLIRKKPQPVSVSE
jgi:transcriptional regulator with XRE-family HTH domain